jgi:hypothetical protein
LLRVQAVEDFYWDLVAGKACLSDIGLAPAGQQDAAGAALPPPQPAAAAQGQCVHTDKSGRTTYRVCRWRMSCMHILLRCHVSS